MKLISFGFKYGQPRANHYFDVSWIKNPARGEGRDLFTTVDNEMVKEVLKDEKVQEFLTRVIPLLSFLSRQDVQVVAFGCSSGRHRSPIIVETIKKALSDNYKIEAAAEHRDIKLC